MKAIPGPLRQLRLLPATLLLALAACASDEPWTFAMSRAVYEEGHFEMAEPGAAAFGVMILVFPFCFDVIALPITLTRDLIVLE